MYNSIFDNIKQYIPTKFSDYVGKISKQSESLPSSDHLFMANFIPSNNSLCDGIGVNEFDFPYTHNQSTAFSKLTLEEGINRIFYHTDATNQYLFALSSLGKLYYANLSSPDDFVLMSNTVFSADLKYVSLNVNNTVYAGFYSSTDDLVLFENAHTLPFSVITPYCFECILPTAQGLFMSVDCNLYFSLDSNIANIAQNELGSIRLNDYGKITKLVSVDDYVIAFCQNGIYQLRIKNQTEIAVNKLFYSGLPIIPNSIVSIFDSIYFSTKSSCFILNSSNSVDLVCQFKHHYKHSLNSLRATNYLNSYLLFFEGEECINPLLSAFTNKQTHENLKHLNNYGYSNKKTTCALLISPNSINYFEGLYVNDLLHVNSNHFSKVLVSLQGDNKSKIGCIDGSGCFLSRPLKKVWVSPKLTLSKRMKNTYIKSIEFDYTSPFTLLIISNNECSLNYLPSCVEPYFLPIDMVGREFYFIFISQESHNNIGQSYLAIK